MSRVCEICGKGRSLGNSVETRGKAKYLGGVGTKITGITRRTFLPNLQNVRTTTANGTSKTVRACTQCVRSGAIRKQVRNAPFKVARNADAVAIGASPVTKPSAPKQKSATKNTTAKSAPPKKSSKAVGK